MIRELLINKTKELLKQKYHSKQEQETKKENQKND